ncbi:hypothetical protein ASG73_00965 [Janibacter sp. Soil728]|uniref:SRPBCC family protein n=1 Tax=Janibacter sp. Soil728 TaxID=1736393 RepID=UPI0006F846A0|nr:SRPBCC family protein [Janibacter sp. Soil728]KRE38970.1 hypothetical protein ASG73_00965 [Janibacter sp. Soil728]
MQFISTFDIPAPISQAWDLLGDIPQIAPCLPGATVRPLSDDTYEGDVAIKVGPIKAGYSGTATVTARDDQAHVMTIEASGREGSGKGSAAATITLRLAPVSDQATRAEVTTDLTITGKLAQFGRSALADVSQRLMDQFADNLARQALGTDTAAPAAMPTGAAPAARTDHAVAAPGTSNELNALALAGPLALRALPVLGAGLVGIVLGALWGRAKGAPAAPMSAPLPPWYFTMPSGQDSVRFPL